MWWAGFGQQLLFADPVTKGKRITVLTLPSLLQVLLMLLSLCYSLQNVYSSMLPSCSHMISLGCEISKFNVYLGPFVLLPQGTVN